MKDKSIEEIKAHVVQLEALGIYILISICLFELSSLEWFPIPAIVLIIIILSGTKLVMRVMNPPNEIRNRLTWAATLGGIMGGFGGGVCDVLSGGLTLGQGTLIGTGIGAFIGGIFGDRIEKEKVIPKNILPSEDKVSKFLDQETTRLVSQCLETYDKGFYKDFLNDIKPLFIEFINEIEPTTQYRSHKAANELKEAEGLIDRLRRMECQSIEKELKGSIIRKFALLENFKNVLTLEDYYRIDQKIAALESNYTQLNNEFSLKRYSETIDRYENKGVGRNYCKSLGLLALFKINNTLMEIIHKR